MMGLLVLKLEFSKYSQHENTPRHLHFTLWRRVANCWYKAQRKEAAFLVFLTALKLIIGGKFKDFPGIKSAAFSSLE